MMSITKTAVLVVAGMVSLLASSANGENFGSKYGGRNDQSHKPHHLHHVKAHHGYRFGYGGCGYRACTLPGSGADLGTFAHGLADLVRSRAAANLVNAQALSQLEVVRSQRMQNSVASLETRLERQRINKESRFGHLHARAAQIAADAADVTVAAADETAEIDWAKRLRPTELDPLTGVIRWPLLLAMSHFQHLRTPIEDVFEARAKSGAIHPDDYLPNLQLIERIREELEMNASIFPREDYVVAQDFLRRLKRETSLEAAQPASGVQFVSNENRTSSLD